MQQKIFFIEDWNRKEKKTLTKRLKNQKIMINLKKIIHYKLELMDGIKNKKNAQKNQEKKIKNQKNKDQSGKYNTW